MSYSLDHLPTLGGVNESTNTEGDPGLQEAVEKYEKGMGMNRWLIFHCDSEPFAKAFSESLARIVGDARIPWRQGAVEDVVALLQKFHDTMKKKKSAGEEK